MSKKSRHLALPLAITAQFKYGNYLYLSYALYTTFLEKIMVSDIWSRLKRGEYVFMELLLKLIYIFRYGWVSTKDCF